VASGRHESRVVLGSSGNLPCVLFCRGHQSWRDDYDPPPHAEQTLPGNPCHRHRTARRPEEGDRSPAATMFGYADLAGLEAAGVEIGAHSHTHRQISPRS